MADINQQSSETPSRHRSVRLKRSSTFIDMTPMVDLAFLLLTFFILTTSFKNTKEIVLTVPDNSPTTHPNTISESRAFNLVLLKDDRIKWYMGSEDKINTAAEADFSTEGINSIDKILLEKNSAVHAAANSVRDSVRRGLLSNKKEIIQSHLETAIKNTNGLVVLIKTADDVKYQSLVKVLDEISLCDIGRYSLSDLSRNEKNYFLNADDVRK